MSHSCKYIRVVLVITAVVASCLGFEAAAKRLSAAEAWARISPSSRVGSQMHKLAYESPQSAYYVFSTGDEGYIVASGDDCVAPVLAVVPDGVFDLDSLPPAARWMLDCYQQEISYKSSVKSSVSDTEDIISLYNKWTAIEPLMTCAWSQHSPYNMLCPVISGQRCVTGCVATAMAQVIRTIGYAKGSGKLSNIYDSTPVEFDYEATPIDFDNLLDAYGYYAPEESKTAVAQLMLACGLSVSMSYSPSESGAHSESVASAIIEHFGYDKNYTRGFMREFYSTSFWESMIYAELLEGRPVYYSGSSNLNSHAFVVDGYKPEGLWHVNWGWGGKSNGYFRLPDLNPTQNAVVGDTSSSGGYNSRQYLVKFVPPSTNPGVTVSEMSGSLSVVSNDVYYVYFQSNNTLLLNLTLGALIVGEGDNDTKSWHQFWTGQNITSTGSLYHDSYYYDFSQADLKPGRYRIYPAVVLDGSEVPTICDPVVGRCHYLNLIVDNNKRYTITNSDSGNELRPHELYVAEITGDTLYSGYSNEMSVTIVNNGGQDFLGNVFFRLTRQDDNSVVLNKRVSSVVVPLGYNTVVPVAVSASDAADNPWPAGTYNLSLTNSSGESILKDGQVFNVSVSATEPPGEYWYPPRDLGITNAASIPEYYAQGDSWNHVPDIYCEKDMQNLTIDVTFYHTGKNMVAKRYVFFQGDLGYIYGSFGKPDFIVDVPFGIYDVCYSANYSPISGRRTVRVGQQFGGIFYLPVDDATVAVCHHPDRAYAGYVNIPSKVEINGKEYAVCEVNSEAFLGCRSLEVLQLPSSIKKIGRDALIYCNHLSDLIINSEDVPFNQRNFVMSGTSVGAVYVPSASYAAYDRVVGLYNDVYASIEYISSAEVALAHPVGSAELTITPEHEAINGVFTVDQIGDDVVPAAEITDVELNGGKLIVHLAANHEGIATYEIRSAQPGVAPGILTINVVGVTAIEDIEAGSKTDVDRMYDLQGRPARDRRGLRIIVKDGKARVVKY